MLQEPWDIVGGDERTEDRFDTYIVFCEDENDEPYYFRSFQIPGRLKVNCIPNQQKAKRSLVNTLEYCHGNGLMDMMNHTYRLKEDAQENIWCVFDRDLENNNLAEIKPKDDIDFTLSIHTAQEAGIKLAWSNDAFELWVLLHFEDVPTGSRLHRTYIYERLTQIFSIDRGVSEAFSEAIKAGTFSYKNHLKRKRFFIQLVLPVLKDKVNSAIERATALEKLYDHQVPYHECNPCTMVHRLARELHNLI